MHIHSSSEHTVQPPITPVFLLILLLMMTACASVKNAPRNIPFVYETEIDLSANGLNGEERSLMEEKLYAAIDDSLQVRSRQILGFTQRLKPALFDSGNVRRSIGFMNGYLNAAGYYNARFDTFTVKMDTLPEKRQIRVSTNFEISLGKKLRVDTLEYFFVDTTDLAFLLDSAKYYAQYSILQNLADSSKKGTILKKGDPYSKDAMGAELDRLSAIFRKNGYLKISRNALVAEADTTDLSLVSMDNDPIEQLLEAQRRLEDPRIRLKVMVRPGVSPTLFEQYYVDSVFLYPETRITEDPDLLVNDTSFVEILGRKVFIIRERDHLYRKSVLQRFNYLTTGKLYDEGDYFRTINGYYKMGPWQQVDVKSFTHYDSLPRVNFHIFLYPSKKHNFQVDLEGSQNNNISVSNTLSGRFFALSLNGTLRNRNLFRSAIQSISSARYGFELNNAINKNSRLFQTLNISATQSFSFPRLIWPMGFLDKRRIDAGRTQIGFGGNYTDRFQFYKQITFNASLQWEWRKGRNSYSFSFPNFESVSIEETDSLRKEIANNPSLRYAFTAGNILSFRGAFERTLVFNRNPRSSGYYRIAAELAPFKFTILNKDAFQFAKIEGQIVYNVTNRRTSWNYRAYGGVGWDISGKPRATMPYFRQYVAGGSNSMRAWGLRQLGVGNSIVSDTAGFTDRFGDIQMEFNAEYRFRLFRLFGFNFGGVAFADMGNIWNHHNNIDGNGKLQLKNLYRDLALCMGTGVRWDVSYLVIRFDVGYKLKDPVREGNGWIKSFEWKTSNRIGSPPKSNLAFQFGIGYPF